MGSLWQNCPLRVQHRQQMLASSCLALVCPTLKALRPLSLWLSGWGRAVICTLRLPRTWSGVLWALRKESPESSGQLPHGSSFWSQCSSSPPSRQTAMSQSLRSRLPAACLCARLLKAAAAGGLKLEGLVLWLSFLA